MRLIKLRQKCDNFEIPYFAMKITRVWNKDKKRFDKDIPKGQMPEGWQKMSYEKAMEWNAKRIKKGLIPTAMNCVLNKGTDGEKVVIDIDEKDHIDNMLQKEGNTFKTVSTGKKMPHLWRKVHPDDKHKKSNDTNVIYGDQCYLNVFESWDAEIEDSELPVFENYDSYYPPKYAKEVKKATYKNVEEVDKYLSKRTADMVEQLLDIIPNDDMDYQSWWNLMCAVKNIHPKLKNVFVTFSQRSKKHNKTKFEASWKQNNLEKYDGLGIHTLKSMAHIYNNDGFMKFSEGGLSMTPEYFCDLFMNEYGDENVVLTEDRRLFMFINGNWFEDPNHHSLKKKIREITQRDLKSNIEELKAEDPTHKDLATLSDTLSKVQKRILVDDICLFVIQNMEMDNNNLNDKVIFDVGKEQLYNLHFKNGVFDLKNMLFRDRTQNDYVTVGNSVNMWNFQETANEDLVKEIEMDFKRLQPNDEQRQFCLEWLSYCLSGDVSKTKMKFNIGLRASNGKTTEFLIHAMCFPKLIKSVSREYFNIGYAKRHKIKIDLIQKPIRIAYIEEIDEKALEASELKDAVDGNKQNCEVMYGTNIEGSFQCKWNFLGQREPNIKEDEGILRRGIIQNYNSKFTDKVDEDDWESNRFPLVMNYQNKYDDDDYKNAYLHLLLRHYKGRDFKIPKECEEKFKDHIEDINEDRNLLDNFQEADDESWLSKKEIARVINKPITSVKGFMKELFPYSKYNKDKMSDGSRGAWNKIKLN